MFRSCSPGICLLALLLVGGCSSEARHSALQTLDELEKITAEHSEAVDAALQDLIEQRLAATSELIEARWQQRLAEERLRIYKRVDRQRSALEDHLHRQLENSLEPTLETAKRQLEQARAANDRQSELARAAELAATLSAGHRAAARLSMHIDESLVEVRRQLLEQLDAADQAPPTAVAIDVGSEAEAIFDAWREDHPNEYADATLRAYRQLERYIELESPIHLMLKGLGGSFSRSLGDQLSNKAQDLFAKGAAAIDERLADIDDKLDTRLAGAASAMLAKDGDEPERITE